MIEQSPSILDDRCDSDSGSRSTTGIPASNAWTPLSVKTFARHVHDTVLSSHHPQTPLKPPCLGLQSRYPRMSQQPRPSPGAPHHPHPTDEAMTSHASGHAPVPRLPGDAAAEDRKTQTRWMLAGAVLFFCAGLVISAKHFRAMGRTAEAQFPHARPDVSKPTYVPWPKTGGKGEGEGGVPSSSHSTGEVHQSPSPPPTHPSDVVPPHQGSGSPRELK